MSEEDECTCDSKGIRYRCPSHDPPPIDRVIERLRADLARAQGDILAVTGRCDRLTEARDTAVEVLARVTGEYESAIRRREEETMLANSTAGELAEKLTAAETEVHLLSEKVLRLSKCLKGDERRSALRARAEAAEKERDDLQKLADDQAMIIFEKAAHISPCDAESRLAELEKELARVTGVQDALVKRAEAAEKLQSITLKDFARYAEAAEKYRKEAQTLYAISEGQRRDAERELNEARAAVVAEIVAEALAESKEIGSEHVPEFWVWRDVAKWIERKWGKR